MIEYSKFYAYANALRFRYRFYSLDTGLDTVILLSLSIIIGLAYMINTKNKNACENVSALIN